MKTAFAAFAAFVLVFASPAGAETCTTLFCDDASDGSSAAANIENGGWTVSGAGNTSTLGTGDYSNPVRFNAGTSAASPILENGAFVTNVVLGARVSNLARKALVTPVTADGDGETLEKELPKTGSLQTVSLDFATEDGVVALRVAFAASGSATAYLYYAVVSTTDAAAADPWQPVWSVTDPEPAPRVGTAFSFAVSAALSDGTAQSVAFAGLQPAAAGTQPAFDGATGVFSWTPDSGAAGDYVASFSVANDGGSYSTEVSFAVKDLTEEDVRFWEDFPNYDNSWSGTAAASLAPSETRVGGWTGSGVYKGRSAVKLGKASEYGSATTPVIETANGAAAEVTLTFDAAAYAGKTGELLVKAFDSETQDVLFAKTVGLEPMKSTSVASLAAYPVGPFTFDARGPFTITFAPASGDGRMAIDSVKVVQTVSTALVDLDVPSGFVIVDGTLSTDAFSVAWDAVPGATGYDVQFRRSGEAEWTAAPSVAAARADLSGLEDDTDYRVRVRATGDTSLYNFSDWSEPLPVRTERSTLHPTLSVGASWANVIGDGKLYGVVPNTIAVSAALDDGTSVDVALVAVSPAPSSAPALANGSLSWTPAPADEGSTFALVFEMAPASGVAYTNAASFKVNALPALKAPTVAVDASSLVNAGGFSSGRAALSWDSQYRASEFSVRAWSGCPNPGATETRVAESFPDFAAGVRPSGWVFKVGGSYSNDATPVKFDANGNWMATYDIGGPISNVTFRIQGNSMKEGSAMRVYWAGALDDEEMADAANWTANLFAEIADLNGSARTVSADIPAGADARRIVWQYTKVSGNAGLGSVEISGEGFSKPKFLPGWGPAPVSQGLAASCTVSPTMAARKNWAEVSVTDGAATLARVVEIDVPGANPATLFMLK